MAAVDLWILEWSRQCALKVRSDSDSDRCGAGTCRECGRVGVGFKPLYEQEIRSCPTHPFQHRTNLLVMVCHCINHVKNQYQDLISHISRWRWSIC